MKKSNFATIPIIQCIYVTLTMENNKSGSNEFVNHFFMGIKFEAGHPIRLNKILSSDYLSEFYSKRVCFIVCLFLFFPLQVTLLHEW